MLFFDKELSGNRDIACATCDYPTHDPAVYRLEQLQPASVASGLPVEDNLLQVEAN